MRGRIELSVQGRVRDQMRMALAQAAEEGGCDALYVADHPGTAAAPFVALAAAASVTERIRLGEGAENLIVSVARSASASSGRPAVR